MKWPYPHRSNVVQCSMRLKIVRGRKMFRLHLVCTRWYLHSKCSLFNCASADRHWRRIKCEVVVLQCDLSSECKFVFVWNHFHSCTPVHWIVFLWLMLNIRVVSVKQKWCTRYEARNAMQNIIHNMKHLFQKNDAILSKIKSIEN